jgi:urate oxidase
MSSYSLGASYGKQSVPVFKVLKHGSGASEVHSVLDMVVQVTLFGAVDKSWLSGDNSQIVPTETQKNTCYAIALQHEFDCPEDYAAILGQDFLSRHRHLSTAEICVQARRWDRIKTTQGDAHNHAFTTCPDPITTTCKVVVDRTAGGGHGSGHGSSHGSNSSYSVRTSSGVKKLRLLKTTQSGFEGFIVDKYTTLQPVGSGAGSVSATRMFSTEMTGTWAFSAKPRGGYAAANSRIRELLVTQFAGDRPDGVFSKSLQETTYKMCTTVLDAYPSVENVCLVTPNIHFYRWEGEQFDLKNDNVVFQSTDPGTTASGRIVTTLSRKRSKL